MEAVVLASARRHGRSDDGILHAHRNPIRVFVFDDLTMPIGADRSGRLLDVGCSMSARPQPSVEFMIHAMWRLASRHPGAAAGQADAARRNSPGLLIEAPHPGSG